MSALRISRPGYPVVLVDLGPSVARKTFARYGIRGGGTMVTGKPAPKTTDEQRAAARIRNQAYYYADPQRAIEKQRAYRAAKKAAS